MPYSSSPGGRGRCCNRPVFCPLVLSRKKIFITRTLESYFRHTRYPGAQADASASRTGDRVTSIFARSSRSCRVASWQYRPGCSLTTQCSMSPCCFHRVPPPPPSPTMMISSTPVPASDLLKEPPRGKMTLLCSVPGTDSVVYCSLYWNKFVLHSSSEMF